MEKYRSVSCRDGNHGVKAAPTSMEELRSHSVIYYAPPNPTQAVGKVKMKKSNDVVGSFSFSKSWSLNDAELQRKRRITGYKAYAMKGKMKGVIEEECQMWIKDTCTQAVYGWR